MEFVQGETKVNDDSLGIILKYRKSGRGWNDVQAYSITPVSVCVCVWQHSYTHTICRRSQDDSRDTHNGITTKVWKHSNSLKISQMY